MEKNKSYDVVIVGSGAAGLTAAIYTARNGLKTVVLEGKSRGGQLTQTSSVENYPGFPEGIEGAELMERARTQAGKFGAEFLAENATGHSFSGSKLEVKTGSGTVTGQSVIFASGASARWLGLDSEAKYRGKGVSACATCDGFFFKDEEVLVIGGGDAAAEEALYLTRFASRIRVIHRRDELRASPSLAKKLKQNESVEIVWNTELVEVLGDGEKVTGARVISHPEGHPKRHLEKDPQNVKKEQLSCSGIFVAIGHSPNTGYLDPEVIPLDERGYVETTGEVFTPVDGVFAAGDVADPRYQQAVTAAGGGCKAALETERYLQH